MPILFVKFSDLPAFKKVNRNEDYNPYNLSRKFWAKYSGVGGFWSILPGAPLAPFAKWLVIHPAPDCIALVYPNSAYAEIKELGARWDRGRKTLCIDKGFCMYTFRAWLPTQREKSAVATSKATHDAMMARNAAMWGGGWESGDDEEEGEEQGMGHSTFLGEAVWLNPGWDAAVAAAQGAQQSPTLALPRGGGYSQVHTPTSVKGGGGGGSVAVTPGTE